MVDTSVSICLLFSSMSQLSRVLFPVLPPSLPVPEVGPRVGSPEEDRSKREITNCVMISMTNFECFKEIFLGFILLVEVSGFGLLFMYQKRH